MQCPPCRGFTPVLAEFYSQLKEEDAAALEVVFVSSDRDAHEFGEYFGSQPWVSMAFENAAARQALGQKFGVRGIPTLIVLDLATGKVRDSDGRSTVAQARGDTSKALAKWE
ncbi:hypothetical protein EON64_11205 [archaeon]|nr:MAG: hypothetical protein EON64_11205 [archaeon]